MKKIISLSLVLAASMLFGMSVTDLNKASKSELLKIKGIGSKKADAIIKYRTKTPFTTISDIENVTGVGPSLSKNIEKDVYKKTKTSKKKTSNSGKSDKKAKDAQNIKK